MCFPAYSSCAVAWHDLPYKHCWPCGMHVMCTLLSPTACARQVAPLRISAQAAGLATSTVFNPVSARFAPAAGCPQAGSMVPVLSPAGQPPGLGEASTPGFTPCATLPAPGMRAGAPAQQRQAKVAAAMEAIVCLVSHCLSCTCGHAISSGYTTRCSASRHAHAHTFALVSVRCIAPERSMPSPCSAAAQYIRIHAVAGAKRRAHSNQQQGRHLHQRRGAFHRRRLQQHTSGASPAPTQVIIILKPTHLDVTRCMSMKAWPAMI